MIDPHKANYGGTPIAAWRKKLAFAPPRGGVRPVLSIVTPYFEGGALFRETVQSVIGQSLQAWEWVIVDDGSRDAESRSLLDGLAHEDERIRVVRHENNRGRSAARNTGIREATTDLLYPLDQDDLLEPTALEKSLWCLLTHPDHHFVNGWCVGFGAQSYLWNRGFDREHEFLVENQVSGRALIHRRVFESAGGYDEALRDGYEDWEFWIRCAERGLWGATIPEYLEWFRRKSPPADWEDPARVAAFRERLREAHPLLDGAFPRTPRAESRAPRPEPFFENPIAPHERRVLLVASSLDFHSNGALTIGAAEILAKQGWQITVAVASERDGSASEAALGRLTADVHVMDRFLPAAEQPRFLAYLVDSRGPAAVLCEATEYGHAMAAWLRASRPAPLYVEVALDDPNRGHAFEDPLAGPGARARFDIGFASTAALAEALGARSGTVEVVPPPIDTTVWKPRREPRRWLRPHWGAGPDDLVVLFTGRFGERNRPRLLARTLLELARRAVPFRAVLQGAGEDRTWLRDFVKRHALEPRVRIEDTPSPDWLLKTMAAADVFLAPSRDGLPVLALRAMSMGLPVVGAACAALAGVVDDETGIAIEAPDDDAEVAAFADALARLAEDPTLRAKLARGARRRVLGRFGPDRLAARWLELLASRKPGAREPLESAGAFERAVECARHIGRAEAIARERSALVGEVARLKEQVGELADWNAEQQRARSWLDAQVQSWQQIAREREELLGKRERWIQDLDAARKWLEGQREHWQRLAQQHAQQASQALADAKRWKETADESERRFAEREREAQRWRTLAEEHAARIAALETEMARLHDATARLQDANERLAAEQLAAAHRLAALSRRWWPGTLRRGAAEAGRKLRVVERSGP